MLVCMACTVEAAPGCLWDAAGQGCACHGQQERAGYGGLGANLACCKRRNWVLTPGQMIVMPTVLSALNII